MARASSRRLMASQGFWERLEERLLVLSKDRQRMARWFQVAYWLSTLFVLVGFAIMFLVWFGIWGL